ncbi:LTA synthase family protein [Gallaecimonas pentaromativorans]|uniref:LTA synthase family protein n=1 Tax=Gallaecimonas pentaromativorans TaxID=584787 RepID=UPI00067ECDA8|nr:LTA synthase family protein [Gallaecimonas pentaromativorans]MED5524668.1 LTA synthase family protein [Pseudomonadota bacterium]
MRSLSLRFILASLTLLTLSRLGLALWLWPRVEAAGGLWPVILGGWRIDLSLLALLCLIPLLLSCWLGHRRWPTVFAAWWYRLCFFALAFMEIATPQFILEYDTRPNRLFFEYLVSPHEVFAMLWEGYKGVLAVSFILLALVAWLAVKALPVKTDARALPWAGRIGGSVALFLLCFLAARGTLEHRPINPSLVAFSDDRLVNTLALDSFYSTAFAAYQLKNESFAGGAYGKMDQQEVIRRVRTLAGLSPNAQDPAMPSLHYQQASHAPAKPLNIVMIVEESLGAQFVGSLGGQDLTPNLDKLAGEGWWFKQAYATGTRSVRGLEALTTGFYPTPARAVLKLPRAQSGFFTLASLLKQYGYHSRFVYGGESHFDNMKNFFLGNGFDEIHDRAKFTNPTFVGSWGASDEDMFRELDNLLSQDRQPTLTVAFSVSNHSPYEYPKGRIQPQGDPASRANGARYADWAIGQFFAKAKTQAYWDNTVFLVVADHDSRVYGANAVPVPHFHIPALILGKGVAPRQDERIVSQVDMAPTLLSLAGISSANPMLGQDLTRQNPDRALMQYGDTFGYLKGDLLTVLRFNKAPEQYRYQGGQLLAQPQLSSKETKDALALALWPSIAYRQGYYAQVSQRQAEKLQLAAKP